MDATPMVCPKCKADLQGERIPEEHRQYYGDSTHYGRVTALYSMEEDRTTGYRCPDCKHEWKRDLE